MCVLELAIQSDFVKQLLRGTDKEREGGVVGIVHKGHLKSGWCNEEEKERWLGGCDFTLSRAM